MEKISLVVYRIPLSSRSSRQRLAVTGFVAIVPARIGSWQWNGVITRIDKFTAMTEDDFINLPIDGRLKYLLWENTS
jgi:hypothetical protein